jgi:hypothetical protein
VRRRNVCTPFYCSEEKSSSASLLRIRAESLELGTGDRDVDGAGHPVIPIVILGNLWFGLAGIIWSPTVSEGLVLVVGVVIWLGSRSAIDRGLDEGSPERAEEVLEQTEA